MPTPGEVLALIEAAQVSKRPEYARAFLLAATTGMRRGELAGLRFAHIDFENRVAHVQRSIGQRGGEPITGDETKNRRLRPVAFGGAVAAADRRSAQVARRTGSSVRYLPHEDAFVLTDSPDGSEPWKPDAVTQYYGRLRERVEIRPELKLKHMRKFMDTYGQELGFSLAQVASRAGHDPAVAGKHYTGRVSGTDRALADAIEALLGSSESVNGETA